MEQMTVRPPAAAGVFYPADPAELAELIDRLLAGVTPESVPGTIRLILSPTAGYVFSHPTAAHAYKLIAGHKYDTVVVIAPSENQRFSRLSIYNGRAYGTPLGDLPIDDTIRQELADEDDDLYVSDLGHVGIEQSLEVQLPFLQRQLGTFKLVPIVMGEQTPEFDRELGHALAEVLSGRNALIVATSDFSPFDLDGEIRPAIVKAIESLDSTALLEAARRVQGGMRAAGPIAAGLIAARGMGCRAARVLDQGVEPMRADVPTLAGFDLSNDPTAAFLSAVAWR